jgi:hypothetical protein
MDGELARALCDQGGFVYRSQALDCGYRPREIAGLLRSREWRRVRHGAYALGSVVDALDPAGLHILTARAVVGSLDGRVVLTHVSALAVHRVPLWGVDLRQVHVHREEAHSTRRSAGVVHHGGLLPESEIIEVDGLLVSVAERSVVDAARIVPFEAGVVLADGGMRLPGFDESLAEGVLERQRDWAGSVNASRVLHFADAAAQTVGESRARVLLARIGVPRPTLQHPIRDSAGRLLGISDFYIEEYETAAEFDGRLKYGRALYEGSNRLDHGDVGDVVWQEKRREDSFRDEGTEVVRIVWSELDGHDREVRGRFDRAFDRFTRRHRAG